VPSQGGTVVGAPSSGSIEIWGDTKRLEHVGNHSFGITSGSCTWIDRHDDAWWVVFAEYGGKRQTPGRDVQWTTLVKFDDDFQRQAAWVFPATVLERMRPYSCSGGSWGPDGRLYGTGHDRQEIYVLELPSTGSSLIHRDTIQSVNPGQGIAWDRTSTRDLFGVDRARDEVVVQRFGWLDRQ